MKSTARARARAAAVTVIASVLCGTGLLAAAPIDPKNPDPINGRAMPLPPASAHDVAFRTLRVKWEQRLPLGGPIVSVGDAMVAASRTGVHLIDAGGHESTRASLETAPEMLTLLGDGRILAQTGAGLQGICLPMSGCRKSFTTLLPGARANVGYSLPAIATAGGGALVASGSQLLALDGDGAIWATTDMGGPISALYNGEGPSARGGALVVVEGKAGSRIRTFHPTGGARTLAEVDGTVTLSVLSGRSLYVAVSGTTLAQIDSDLRTAVPLVQAPGGIYAMAPYFGQSGANGAGPGVVALIGTQLGYSLLLLGPRGSRQVPVENLLSLDGGAPPVGLGYAAIASDSNGFVAFLTPSGALSMLTPDGSVLRYAERPCGVDRLPRPPVLSHMRSMGLVLGCPSGRTIAFVSE